jgi:tetratricopeptide (TPR) repeat protein
MSRTAASILPILILCLCGSGCATSSQNKDIAIEYYNAGNEYFALGRYEKAAELYGDALRLDPTLTDAGFNLSLSLVRLQKTDEAIKIINELLARDPKNVSVMAVLGWAYHIEGREEEALSQYDAILALSPENRDAWYNSGLILWKLNRAQDAVDRFKRLIALAPDEGDALYALGSLYLTLEDPGSAADYLDRYLQGKPDDADAQLLLADAEERMEKYSQALDAYDRIISINSKEPRAWFGKARLLLTVVEDPDKGVSALTQSLELGFHDMEAIKVLLSSELLQNRDAVEAALKARNMLPTEETAPPPQPETQQE